MAEQIYQIFDKIIKKILTLSAVSVINLINGLFGTNYPKDSTISYNWTEFEDDELRRTLADTILTINERHSYHIEAQMYEDGDIVFRVFSYGYQHAERNRTSSKGTYILKFPEPKIIYLYASGKIPETYSLDLDFGTQGHFIYKVSTFNFMETSLEELNQKKLVILIPFQLLKLRKLLEKDRCPENLKALQNLIQNDIIGSIETNLKLGNISMDDARRLRRLTKKLYDYIYAHYEEMEVLNEMTDESLLLDFDIIEKEHAKALAEKEKSFQKVLAEMDNALLEKESALQEKANALQEKDNALQEKNNALQEKDNALQEKDNALQNALQEKDDALKEKDMVLLENQRLKAEIAKLLQR